MIFTGKLPVSPPSKRLLDQLYNQIRIKHYPSRTEEAYAYWVREFILFHKAKSGTFRHPGEMGISVNSTNLLAFLPTFLVVQNE